MNVQIPKICKQRYVTLSCKYQGHILMLISLVETLTKIYVSTFFCNDWGDDDKNTLK